MFIPVVDCSKTKLCQSMFPQNKEKALKFPCMPLHTTPFLLKTNIKLSMNYKCYDRWLHTLHTPGFYNGGYTR